MLVTIPVCIPSEELRGFTFSRQSIYVNPDNVETIGVTLIDEGRAGNDTFTAITFVSGEAVYSLETPARVAAQLSSRNLQCRKRKPATSKTASNSATRRLKTKA